MIVYGKNVFQQIQDNPQSVEEICLLSGFKDKKVLELLKGIDPSKIKYVNRQTLDKMSENGIHQGIAARMKDIKTFTLDELLKKKKGEKGFFIALDEVQDPHNVGAILRTADCAGADGVILCKHNAAGLTPAAIKASTGAVYTVPVAVVNNLSKALQEMKKQGYWVAGTDLTNARDYREGMYDENTVIVIGNEGKGISPLVKKNCDYMVSLPMKGSIESLNASVAAALLMYEVMRQREEGK